MSSSMIAIYSFLIKQDKAAWQEGEKLEGTRELLLEIYFCIFLDNSKFENEK